MSNINYPVIRVSAGGGGSQPGGYGYPNAYAPPMSGLPTTTQQVINKAPCFSCPTLVQPHQQQYATTPVCTQQPTSSAVQPIVISRQPVRCPQPPPPPLPPPPHHCCCCGCCDWCCSMCACPAWCLALSGLLGTLLLLGLLAGLLYLLLNQNNAAANNRLITDTIVENNTIEYYIVEPCSPQELVDDLRRSNITNFVTRYPLCSNNATTRVRAQRQFVRNQNSQQSQASVVTSSSDAALLLVCFAHVLNRLLLILVT